MNVIKAHYLKLRNHVWSFFTMSYRESSPIDLFSSFFALFDSFSDMILPKSELKGYFQPWMKLVGGLVGIRGGAGICGGGGNVVSGLVALCSGESGA